MSTLGNYSEENAVTALLNGGGASHSSVYLSLIGTYTRTELEKSDWTGELSGSDWSRKNLSGGWTSHKTFGGGQGKRTPSPDALSFGPSNGGWTIEALALATASGKGSGKVLTHVSFIPISVADGKQLEVDIEAFGAGVGGDTSTFASKRLTNAHVNDGTTGLGGTTGYHALHTGSPPTAANEVSDTGYSRQFADVNDFSGGQAGGAYELTSDIDISWGPFDSSLTGIGTVAIWNDFAVGSGSPVAYASLNRTYSPSAGGEIIIPSGSYTVEAR